MCARARVCACVCVCVCVRACVCVCVCGSNSDGHSEGDSHRGNSNRISAGISESGRMGGCLGDGYSESNYNNSRRAIIVSVQVCLTVVVRGLETVSGMAVPKLEPLNSSNSIPPPRYK